jgi:hypothetical protein
MTPYFSLLSRAPGDRWCVEFGAYDRETVLAEYEEMRDNCDEPGWHFKIVCTGDGQADIQEALDRLNRGKP